MSTFATYFSAMGGGGGGGVAWGGITGTLSNQTDLQAALDLKAPLASPSFTGTIGTALTISRALVTDGSGNLAVSTTTSAELAFVAGVTSAIQTQLNGKQASGSYITALTGDVTASGPGSAAASISSATVTAKLLTGFVSGAGTVSATDSILSAIDKLDGNIAGKQASGNYITALTGDATASGPGSVALTLATVNAGVGSFGTATQVPAITVNAKGLVTAAANTSIQIAESQVTNLVSDLAGKQATGNYITALTGDVTASGPGSVAASISASTVTGKLLTGFVAAAGTVSASDSILTGFNKLAGNGASNILIAYMSGSLTTTTSTVYDIVYDVVVLDTDSAYNNTTGEYTVPVTGVYSINTQATWSNVATGIRELNIVVNTVNTRLISEFVASSAGNATVTEGSPVLLLTAGDVVKINASQNSGSNVDIIGGSYYNAFSIFRVK